MQKKNYIVNFGNAVTAFPRVAAKMIASGAASPAEARVLAAMLMGNGSSVGIPKLCTQTGLDENDVLEALAFWRGAGVISSGNDNIEQSEESKKQESAQPSDAVADEPEAPKKKVLLSREMPKYTGLEISAMLEKDGGKLRKMIDMCQELIGHIFNPNEVNTVLGLCDWLGLEADYVITLVAYYVEKKPGCNVRYIQSAATALVNDGVDTIESLDAYIRNMEIYDGVSGKLRSLAGMGARTFTKKENRMMNRWVKDMRYGEDIIELAYEVCCDNTSEFSFDYMNRVLENWYSSGIKTVSEAQAEMKRYKEEKEKNTPQKGASSGKLSFDPDKFMKLAIKRSGDNMSGMAKKK